MENVIPSDAPQRDPMSPVHRHLDDELTTLRELLIEMSQVVDEQIRDAIRAVSTCDLDLAQRIRDRDDEVDGLELKIDHHCERILALHNPVAVDLRLIIFAVKINTDLERIGDHAKNLAKNTRYLAEAPHLVDETRITEMADMARSVLKDAQRAFITRDRVLARTVLARDRQIDTHYLENFFAIVENARNRPEHAEVWMHLATMAKAIERIADHAKNIAESVIFLVEGTDIRHRRVEERPRAN
jgi:phosphate transport system protein